MAQVSFSYSIPSGDGIPVVQVGATFGQLEFTSPNINGRLLVTGTQLDTGAGTLSGAKLVVAGLVFMDMSQIGLPEMALLTASQGGDLQDLLAYLLKGNDTVRGDNRENTTLYGFGGNDTYYVNSDYHVIESTDRSGGKDTVHLTSNNFSYLLPQGVENLVFEDLGRSATGNGLDNFVQGSDLDNAFDGRDGNDTVLGGAGNDNLVGGNGNDSLAGGVGSDGLAGEAGNDTLVGGSFGDRLDGGAGRDLLTGGEGWDAIYLRASTESGLTAATRDLVTDFEVGTRRSHDLFNLEYLTHRGVHVGDFVFIGDAPFTADTQNQIRTNYNARTDQTIVLIDLDRDRDPEMSIALAGQKQLEAYHFFFW